MHEIEIASKVLREAQKAGATRFVKVEVGELVEITPGELEEGLHKISSGELHVEPHSHGEHIHTHDFNENELKEIGEKTEGWKFEVCFVKSLVKCDCGYFGEARIVDRGHGYCVFNCPSCSGKPSVEAGGEIRVVGVE